MSALQHNRRSSYLETFQLGYPDLVFGTDYRERRFCVRPYDDHYDGHLTWREGGYDRYRNHLTIIRLSDGAKCFVRKHAGHFDGYSNTDAFARKCLGLLPNARWCAR
jgi:hypothetical protein